jgi:ribA/ribD-fused uncharacterized protein
MITELTATVNGLQEIVSHTQKAAEMTSAELRKTQQCLDVTNAEVIITKQKCEELLRKPTCPQSDMSGAESNMSGSFLKELDKRTKDILSKVTPHTIDSDDETDAEDDADQVEPNGNLLIGDSMIRDIRPISADLSVDSHGGARFNDLRKCIRQINPKKQQFQNIYIVCGTNDISTKKPAEKIAKECEKLLQEATLRAEKVHLSSVMPRMDSQSFSTKIDTLNQFLTTLANTHKVTFINNDKNFKYRDDTTDVSLLSPADSLHLSLQGTTKLLQNLQLDEVAKATTSSLSDRWNNNKTVYTSNCNNQKTSIANTSPTQPCATFDNQLSSSNVTQPSGDTVLFNGPRDPLSNLYMTPINIWGIKFESTEHAYNYRKAVEMSQFATAEDIRNAGTSHEAMHIAKRVNTDDRWLNMKQNVMYELLKVKLSQCAAFQRSLAASKGKMLTENTTHNYWGRGRSGEGLNMLGRLLMTLRDSEAESAQSRNMSVLQQGWSNQYHHSNSRLPAYHDHQRSYGRQQNRTQPGARSDVFCWYCGEQNYTSQTCRHGKPIQCFKCRTNGHKSKHCTH